MDSGTCAAPAHLPAVCRSYLLDRCAGFAPIAAVPRFPASLAARHRVRTGRTMEYAGLGLGQPDGPALFQFRMDPRRVLSIPAILHFFVLRGDWCAGVGIRGGLAGATSTNLAFSRNLLVEPDAGDGGP